MRKTARLGLYATGAAVAAPWLLQSTGCSDALVQGPRAEQGATDKSSFDGNRALGYLKAQVAFGPRNPGSSGHQACLRYLTDELSNYADQVDQQPFTFNDQGKIIEMTNVVGLVSPEKQDRILLCAHWDTRPTADNDPDPLNRNKPIPGANDGASGVAVLLESARMFKQTRPDVGLDIAFLDGEDYGPGLDKMFLGAKYLAANPPSPRPRYGILLDMVGDRDQKFFWEGNSGAYAKDIMSKFWQAADDLGYGDYFSPQIKYNLWDDHIPLSQSGIPTIDVIDFDYPYWHTMADTPDKCSAESLGRVGRVLSKVVYDEKSIQPANESSRAPTSFLNTAGRIWF